MEYSEEQIAQFVVNVHHCRDIDDAFTLRQELTEIAAQIDQSYITAANTLLLLERVEIYKVVQMLMHVFNQTRTETKIRSRLAVFEQS